MPAQCRVNGSVVELWICMDFEWTCDEGEDRQVHSEEGEIIEFSYAIYDARAGQVVCEGQHYCKNLRTPITTFCTDLTGITAEKLADAGSLQDALEALNRALSSDGLAGRPCCAVTHGSADLELMLPLNCKALGLEVPAVLRRYVDLREAVQTHLATQGIRGVRASTLRQICEALHVEMFGEEHCGLDDSWMVLFATQQLIQAGADLQAADLDSERAAFLGGCCQDVQKLCLDGLPFFALASEVRPWLEGLTGQDVFQEDLQVVLGMDGRPSGRAVVDFRDHKAAIQALSALDGGRRIVVGSVDTWPFEPPKERLVLARPLRRQELRLPRRGPEAGPGGGPGLAPFPADAQALAVFRSSGKGRGKGGKNRLEPAEGCDGTVKLFNSGKGFGFISFSEGEVFMHCSDCPDGVPAEGDRVSFDVVEDPRSHKMKAVNVLLLQGAASGRTQASAAGGQGLASTSGDSFACSP